MKELRNLWKISEMIQVYIFAVVVLQGSIQLKIYNNQVPDILKIVKGFSFYNYNFTDHQIEQMKLTYLLQTILFPRLCQCVWGGEGERTHLIVDCLLEAQL